MKTKLNLCILSLIIATTCFAQIPNSGFENIDTANAPLNWIYTGSVSIGIGDSILTDGPLISKSNDAHSGLYALELRNTYNYTTNTPFMNGTANATLPDSTMYQGFNQFIPLVSKPYALDFYYKYSQNPYNDSTVCNVLIFNSDLAEIGNGTATFWDINSNYQLKTVNINYYPLIEIAVGDSIPAAISVQFKNKVTTTVPHVGQRTLIDDVALNYTPLGLNVSSNNEIMQCYPNPVLNQLIFKSTDAQVAEIFSFDGQLVSSESLKNCQSIDVSNLANGSYVLMVTDTKGIRFKQKFIKQ